MRLYAFAAVLAFVAAVPAAAQPTYSREVSRILQDKCQSCHRPGEVAPFALMTYEDVRSRWRAVRSAVESRKMPPWKPVPGHGEFLDNISLTDEQRSTILRWIEAEMPEGEAADLPPPREWPGEWRRGTPHQILQIAKPYVPVARADRPDRYRCFILPAVADQDRWVRSVDVLPGIRESVHHVLLYLTDEADQIRRAEEFEIEDDEPGYDCWGGPRVTPGAGPSVLKIAGGLLGGWAPGFTASVLPDDVGILLPKGVTVIMQVHYNLSHEGHQHEHGKSARHHEAEPEADQTRVGLYFHEKTPKFRLLSLPLANQTFVLEPGAMGKVVNATFEWDLAQVGLRVPDFLVPKFSMVQVAPHMHQLGRKIEAHIAQPDGAITPLIRIDDWDFHWQNFYTFQNAVPVPYRSKVKMSCTFDNTTSKDVRWGEGTEDEMCLLYIGFIADGPLAVLFGNPLFP